VVNAPTVPTLRVTDSRIKVPTNVAQPRKELILRIAETLPGSRGSFIFMDLQRTVCTDRADQLFEFPFARLTRYL
jgi:hypothetical protein